ncbi:MAG: hypothetical protein HQL32_00200 [Planctomycetes bacterium]|nr:hypothetical protein [Planctomycetota bacterium]
MEIGSYNGIPPQDPSRRSGRPAHSETKESSELETDSFSGPNLGELKEKLADIDPSRQDLIDEVKRELESGSYFTEQRIQSVVEKLSSLL